MKVVIVNSKDLFDKKKNPTLCLSPLRYTNGCLECLKHVLQRENYNLEAVLKKVKCNPIITDDMLKWHREKELLREERRILQAKINELDSKLGLKIDV